MLLAILVPRMGHKTATQTDGAQLLIHFGHVVIGTGAELTAVDLRHRRNGRDWRRTMQPAIAVFPQRGTHI